MTDLKIDVRTMGPVAVVEPVGMINAHTAKSFEASLQKLLDGSCNRIVINCRGLEYIASAGLGVIMGFLNDVREGNGDIRLSNMNPTVFNIFEILGFTHFTSIFDSEETAVRSFQDAAQ
jgi:anti-sigma B factor antagonist